MVPTAEILSIGTEIVKGNIINSTAPKIAQSLSSLGFLVQRITSCPDEVSEIVLAVKEAIKRSQLVVLTGGLGGTPDDLTKEALAQALNLPLVADPLIKEKIGERLPAYHQKELLERVSVIPQGAQRVFDSKSLVPALFFEVSRGKSLVALPGVPSETRSLWQKVLPLIKKRHTVKLTFTLNSFNFCGVTEADILSRLGEDLKTLPPGSVNFYPNGEEVRLVFHDLSKKQVNQVRKWIHKKMPATCYGEGDETLSEVVGKILREKEFTLAVAESITGGLVGKSLTDVPGSSDYFLGSLVAYRSQAKVKFLGVDPRVIEEKGTVSAECALEMAKRAKEKFAASLGVSVTGNAGPEAIEDKPIGLVFAGLSGPYGDTVMRFQFKGERSEVRLKSSQRCLNLIRLYLLKEALW